MTAFTCAPSSATPPNTLFEPDSPRVDCLSHLLNHGTQQMAYSRQRFEPAP